MKRMPWEERTVKMSREAFVREVESGERSKSQVCREYGISRVTGYKWLKRHTNGEELYDRSKAPFHVANKTPLEKEKRFWKLGKRIQRGVLGKSGIFY